LLRRWLVERSFAWWLLGYGMPYPYLFVLVLGCVVCGRGGLDLVGRGTASDAVYCKGWFLNSLLVCALHDQCDWGKMRPPLVEATVACLDGILRVRLDGSIQWVHVPRRWFVCRDDGALTGSRDPWRLMSDIPCPADICDDTDC